MHGDRMSINLIWLRFSPFLFGKRIRAGSFERVILVAWLFHDISVLVHICVLCRRLYWLSHNMVGIVTVRSLATFCRPVVLYGVLFILEVKG